MDLPEIPDCLIQNCGFIAQIGAKGDAGAHESLSETKDILHVVES